MTSADLLSCNVAANRCIQKKWKFKHGGTIHGIARQQGKMYDQHFYSSFISSPAPDISQVAFPAKPADIDSETSSNEAHHVGVEIPETIVRDATLADVPSSKPVLPCSGVD